MKKIILSVAMIAAVAAVAIGATTAYFSDVETSTGNTFTAGAIDLTVDNTCTYNGAPCPDVLDAAGKLISTSNWQATDLGAIHKFFYFPDVKPGDSGEDTISLHLDSNDACAFAKITKTADLDNTCTEPEGQAVVDANCTDGDGELDDNTIFTIWSDMGSFTPNSDCTNDASVPGDNKYDPTCGDIQLTTGTLDAVENWGLGKLTGNSTTYYGISWTVPGSVLNEAQTDSFVGDIEFTVEQYRNQYGPNTPNPNGCPVGDIRLPD